MPAKATRTATPPLDELQRLLPRITTRELYEAAVAILEEAADRANNYASLLGEPEVDPAAIEEGLAMATRFNGLYRCFTGVRRVDEASQMLLDARDDLTEAWS